MDVTFGMMLPHATTRSSTSAFTISTATSWPGAVMKISRTLSLSVTFRRRGLCVQCFDLLRIVLFHNAALDRKLRRYFTTVEAELARKYQDFLGPLVTCKARRARFDFLFVLRAYCGLRDK